MSPEDLAAFRARLDATIRALDSARRLGRRRALTLGRLAAARRRLSSLPPPHPHPPPPAAAPTPNTLASFEPLLASASAEDRGALRNAFTLAVAREEWARETGLLESALAALGGAPEAAGTVAEIVALVAPEDREREARRSEVVRALVAVEGDRAALAEAVRLAERAEWQIARARDCLAPVKVDFLFDLRGGGGFQDLASSGRLDQSRSYLRGARELVLDAESRASAASGAALKVDEDLFSLEEFFRELFADFEREGFARGAIARLRAMAETLRAAAAPLRARARDAERDARALLAEADAFPP